MKVIKNHYTTDFTSLIILSIGVSKKSLREALTKHKCFNENNSIMISIYLLMVS